jgi:hypothetical protein
MTRPLVKRDSNGKVYERPEEIEAALEISSRQDLGELKRRAEIADKKSREFLPSECLVHLIREARRGGNDESMNGLLPILLRRCAANLKRTVPDSSLGNAAEVREEILGEFSVLFAEDGKVGHFDELDFYECRFNRAFRALRISIYRREAKVTRRLETLDKKIPGDDGGEEEYAARDSEEFRKNAAQIPRIYLNELLRSLPENERVAVILCVLMEYKQESDDPQERTAASICKVSGRTIRHRLSRALTKLAELKSKKEV